MIADICRNTLEPTKLFQAAILLTCIFERLPLRISAGAPVNRKEIIVSSSASLDKFYDNISNYATTVSFQILTNSVITDIITCPGFREK
jgi:hypothetical protein